MNLVYRKNFKKHFSRFRPSFFRLRNRLLLSRGIRFLPHLFTLGNAFFGFCSIVLAFEGEFVASAYCIFIGALMDALDGRIARFIHVESDLGLQLDSLCDAISFCVAPAFLAYAWLLRSLGMVGLFVAVGFVLTGVLRLARFNLIHDQQTIFFIGVPTTIAGCFVTTVLLNFRNLFTQQWFVSFFALLVCALAWLMVSNVRFPAFKKKMMFHIKKEHAIVVVAAIFAIFAVMQLQGLLLIVFVTYFVSSLVYNILGLLGRKNNKKR